MWLRACRKNHDPEVPDWAAPCLWKHLNSADIIFKTSNFPLHMWKLHVIDRTAYRGHAYLQLVSRNKIFRMHLHECTPYGVQLHPFICFKIWSLSSFHLTDIQLENLRIWKMEL